MKGQSQQPAAPNHAYAPLMPPANHGGSPGGGKDQAIQPPPPTGVASTAADPSGNSSGSGGAPQPGGSYSYGGPGTPGYGVPGYAHEPPASNSSGGAFTTGGPGTPGYGVPGYGSPPSTNSGSPGGAYSFGGPGTPGYGMPGYASGPSSGGSGHSGAYPMPSQGTPTGGSYSYGGPGTPGYGVPGYEHQPPSNSGGAPQAPSNSGGAPAFASGSQNLGSPFDKAGGTWQIGGQTPPASGGSSGAPSDPAAAAQAALAQHGSPTSGAYQQPPSSGAYQPQSSGAYQPQQAQQPQPPQGDQAPLPTNFALPGDRAPAQMQDGFGANLGDPTAISNMMQQARDSAYRQATGYLDPQWQNQQRDEETRLANQGVSQNSEAWNRAMDDFNRQRTFAYGQAEQGAYGQGLQAQGQMADQLLQQLGFRTQENVAGIGANASMSNTNNALNAQQRQNDFTNSLSLRNQDINELLLQQQNPLQMFNSLTQGTGVQTPNFTSTPGSTMSPTDISGIYQQAMNQRNNVYNAQVGATNSQNAGGAAILAALLSDRRAKTDIEKVGKTDDGLPVYTYRYKGSPTTQMGVMAQDVEKKKPEAVVEHPSGLKMVRYDKL